MEDGLLVSQGEGSDLSSAVLAQTHSSALLQPLTKL